MMSATRLLILGALRFMQPAHGYEIRRTLETWNADQWANIAYGSIYHALNKMAEEGFLKPVNTERVDIVQPETPTPSPKSAKKNSNDSCASTGGRSNRS
jgi:DNA-binding PadR family transcriptional regulator